MVNCQGGKKLVHQPVLLMAACGRNELTNNPMVGTDQSNAIKTTMTVRVLLLSACTSCPASVRRCPAATAAPDGFKASSALESAPDVVCVVLIAGPPGRGSAEC